MKTMTKESLQRKLARLESALDTERARLRKSCDDIPWGAGMRRTKCTPSFRRENERKHSINSPFHSKNVILLL